MADGEIIIPAIGLSTVTDPLPVDDTVLISDTENGLAYTRIRGTGGGNVVEVLSLGPPYLVESPAALAAVVDDFAPTNIISLTHLRLTPDAVAGTVLGGIASAGLSVFDKKIINIGADPLTIVDESTTPASIAANRFKLPATLPSFPNLVVSPDEPLDIWYDIIISRWRMG